MAKFIIVDWDDDTSDFYREDEVVLKDGNQVIKQFGKKIYEGKIVSYHSTKASAKQELADRTEAHCDVAAVLEESRKRERRMTSKMQGFTFDQIAKDPMPGPSVPIDAQESSTEKDRPKQNTSKSNKTSQKKKTTKDIIPASELRRAADVIMSTEMTEDSTLHQSDSPHQSCSSPPSPTIHSLQTEHLQLEDLTPMKSVQCTTPATVSTVSVQCTTTATVSTVSVQCTTTATVSTVSVQCATTDTVSTVSPSPSTSHTDTHSYRHDTYASSQHYNTQQYNTQHYNTQVDRMTEPSWQDQSFGTMMGNAIAMSVQFDEDNMMPTLARPRPQYASQCQSCQQLKVTVENLQQQVYHLNQTCYSFNSRLYQMEQHMAEMMDNQRQAQKQPSQVERPDSPSSGHNRSHSEKDLYNGFTKAQLIHDLPGKGWKGDSKWLLRRMFTLDEFRGHSVTGGHGKTKKTGSVRPPLEDQRKLSVLYDIIMEKYQGRVISDIILVLADVVKPSAPGMADK